MKLLFCLFFLSVVTADTKTCAGQSCLRDVVSLTNLMKSMASEVLENSKIVCIDAHYTGAYATCPTDYACTGCACGMGCGSWDIQSQNTCHCQCKPMDWTTARCCKVGSK
ncbi:resistin-like beta [Lithobates pipiens]